MFEIRWHWNDERKCPTPVCIPPPSSMCCPAHAEVFSVKDARFHRGQPHTHTLSLCLPLSLSLSSGWMCAADDHRTNNFDVLICCAPACRYSAWIWCRTMKHPGGLHLVVATTLSRYTNTLSPASVSHRLKPNARVCAMGITKTDNPHWQASHIFSGHHIIFGHMAYTSLFLLLLRCGACRTGLLSRST